VVQKSAEGILGDICRTKARTLEVTSRCSDIAATMRLNSGQSASGWRERVKPGLALIRGVEADATMADIQTTASIEQLLPLNPANRRIRTRMYGGVGGGSREVSPYPDWSYPHPRLPVLARNRHAGAVVARPLLGDQRTWLGRGSKSENDPLSDIDQVR
jgi:hypothetical protein